MPGRRPCSETARPRRTRPCARDRQRWRARVHEREHLGSPGLDCLLRTTDVMHVDDVEGPMIWPEAHSAPRLHAGSHVWSDASRSTRRLISGELADVRPRAAEQHGLERHRRLAKARRSILTSIHRGGWFDARPHCRVRESVSAPAERASTAASAWASSSRRGISRGLRVLAAGGGTAARGQAWRSARRSPTLRPDALEHARGREGHRKPLKAPEQGLRGRASLTSSAETGCDARMGGQYDRHVASSADAQSTR